MRSTVEKINLRSCSACITGPLAQRKVEKNASTSAKVPDTETMETVEYEELPDVPHCTNDSSKQKSPGVTSNDKAPAVVILEENDYDEIGDILIGSSPSDTTTELTTNATYYNTPGKHLALLDNPIRDENSTASHSEETQTKGSVNKAAKLIQEKSNGKFVQVDGFCGQRTFFAYKCPTGGDAVGEFWRFVGDRNIQNVVLLEDVACKVLPAASGSTFEGIKVFCKEEWQSKGIKRFIVTLSNEHLCEDADYLNQQWGISVLTMDHELTNEAIISLRQILLPIGESPECVIMCKNGQQFSGFFISVNCMLDMVDEGKQIDVVHGLNKFKTVCPDFVPTEEQLLQLSHLARDYISYGDYNN